MAEEHTTILFLILQMQWIPTPSHQLRLNLTWPRQLQLPKASTAPSTTRTSWFTHRKSPATTSTHSLQLHEKHPLNREPDDPFWKRRALEATLLSLSPPMKWAPTSIHSTHSCTSESWAWRTLFRCMHWKNWKQGRLGRLLIEAMPGALAWPPQRDCGHCWPRIPIKNLIQTESPREKSPAKKKLKRIWTYNDINSVSYFFHF